MSDLSPYETKDLFQNMRPLVTDFELSCLLRSAEIPQKTALYWHRASIAVAGHKPEVYLSNNPEGAHCAAHTAEELHRLLDPSFTTVRAGKVWVFIDLMACTFKKLDDEATADGKVEGGGLVLHMVKGCEDITQVHCLARGVLVLAAKNILEHQREAKREQKS